MNRFAKVLASIVFAGALVTPFALGQDNSDRGGNEERGERGERGDRDERSDRGRGWGDPEQMQAFAVERLQRELAPTDEEWTVIKPKLEKVISTRFSQFGGFGGFRRSGPDGGEEREPRNDVERASRDLRTTLKDTGASADTIAAKLTALRDARTKAAESVKAAQEDLKSILTARQEAILVVNGALE